VAAFKLDPFSTTVDLGLLNTSDILSYVYTLTAEGTTHGFERGYQAFIGDPFGVDVVTDNLNVTVSLAGACWLRGARTEHVGDDAARIGGPRLLALAQRYANSAQLTPVLFT
jgi:hypothetical protein